MLQQLLADARVLATPHLGASAREVQAQVAVEVGRQIISVLRGDSSPAPSSIMIAERVMGESLLW